MRKNTRKKLLEQPKPCTIPNTSNLSECYPTKKDTTLENILNFNYSPNIALRCPSNVCKIVDLISLTDLPKNCSEAVYSNSSAFMILHCATPVTVRGTPWAVSTPSHIGFRVMTSRERRWTSVTHHHAHAHPPTMVTRFVEPQQPPAEKGKR